jgi:hypothetical protein
MSALPKILQVRKARERSIRARLHSIEMEIARERESIEGVVLERRQLHERWRAAIARRGIHDQTALHKHTDHLSRLHAEDLDAQERIERHRAKLEELEMKYSEESEVLKRNLVGQEKLGWLIEEGVGRAEEGGRK